MPEGVTNTSDTGMMPYIAPPAYLKNNGYNKASNPEMKFDGGIPHNFARQRSPKPIKVSKPKRS